MAKQQQCAVNGTRLYARGKKRLSMINWFHKWACKHQQWVDVRSRRWGTEEGMTRPMLVPLSVFRANVMPVKSSEILPDKYLCYIFHKHNILYTSESPAPLPANMKNDESTAGQNTSQKTKNEKSMRSIIDKHIKSGCGGPSDGLSKNKQAERCINGPLISIAHNFSTEHRDHKNRVKCRWKKRLPLSVPLVRSVHI